MQNADVGGKTACGVDYQYCIAVPKILFCQVSALHTHPEAMPCTVCIGYHECTHFCFQRFYHYPLKASLQLITVLANKSCTGTCMHTMGSSQETLQVWGSGENKQVTHFSVFLSPGPGSRTNPVHHSKGTLCYAFQVRMHTHAPTYHQISL